MNGLLGRRARASSWQLFSSRTASLALSLASACSTPLYVRDGTEGPDISGRGGDPPALSGTGGQADRDESPHQQTGGVAGGATGGTVDMGDPESGKGDGMGRGKGDGTTDGTGGGPIGSAMAGAAGGAGAVPVGGSRFGGAGGEGGNRAGAAGMGGTAPSPPAVIDCRNPSAPPTGLLCDFDVFDASTRRWKASNGLAGKIFSYHGGPSSSAVTTATRNLHFTASLSSGSWAGCGIIFDSCQAFDGNAVLRFAVAGSTGCTAEVQLQTYDQRPATDLPAGGCDSSARSCVNYAAATHISLAGSPVTVPLSSFSGWSGSLARQVVGVQWQLTNTGSTTCTADLRFDDVALGR